MRDAFTLLETMLVMIVLAAGSLIGLYAVRSDFGDQRVVEATSRLVEQQLRTARQMAISYGTDVMVTAGRSSSDRDGVSLFTEHQDVVGALGLIRSRRRFETALGRDCMIDRNGSDAGFAGNGFLLRRFRWNVVSKTNPANTVSITAHPITGLVNRQYE